MVKLLALLAILAIVATGGLALSVCSMVYGYGVQPQNWGWILGSYAGVLVLTTLGNLIGKAIN